VVYLDPAAQAEMALEGGTAIVLAGLGVAAVAGVVALSSDGGDQEPALPVNTAPTITSAAAISVAENNTVTGLSVVATDAERFAVDLVSGALRFIAAPDFEVPGDADGNNVYQLVLTPSDGVNSTTQNLAVTVANANDVALVITSGAAVLVQENGTAVTQVVANDAEGDPGIVAAVNAALAANPRIGAATQQLAAEEARAQRARRNRLPVIEIVGIASYARDNFQGGDFGLRERVGIDVTIPLVTGGRLQADQQRSAADVQARSSELQRLRLDIAEQVEVAARRIVSMRGQLAQREQVVARQGEQFAAAQSEFSEGLRTLPDLVEDRLALESVRIEAVATRFALLREIAVLQALTGQMQPEASDQPYGPTGQ
jgi:Outer membrane efflux protein